MFYIKLQYLVGSDEIKRNPHHILQPFRKVPSLHYMSLLQIYRFELRMYCAHSYMTKQHIWKQIFTF